MTVVKDGRTIASVMSFYFRDEVLPYYGGGTAEARDLAGLEGEVALALGLVYLLGAGGGYGRAHRLDLGAAQNVGGGLPELPVDADVGRAALAEVEVAALLGDQKLKQSL